MAEEKLPWKNLTTFKGTTKFERSELRSQFLGAFKGKLNASKYSYNPWLSQRIKAQAEIEQELKFFGKNIGDLSAAPDTIGKRSMQPQTIPEGLKIITQARDLVGNIWGVDGQNVLGIHSSASLLSEAILGTAAHKDDVLTNVVVSHFGAFSDRTRRQTKSLGLKHEVISVKYGAAPTADDIIKKISKNTTLITMPHLETGTAQEINLGHVLRRVAEDCKAKGIEVPLIAFDATSSRGTVNLNDYKELPVAMYFSTPKTTGSLLMSHIAATDLAMERMVQNRLRMQLEDKESPYYSDLVREMSHQSPKKFFQIAGRVLKMHGAELQSNLKKLGYNVAPDTLLGRAHFTQGMAAYIWTSRKLLERHMEAAVLSGAKTRESLQDAMDDVSNIKRKYISGFRKTALKTLGFEPYGPKESQSIMLNAFVPPEGVDAASFKEFVRKKQGIVFGLGYGGVQPEDWANNVHPRVKTANDIFRLQDYLSMHSFGELMGFSKRVAIGGYDYLKSKNIPTPKNYKAELNKLEKSYVKNLGKELNALKE
ncbi:hypothetical protein HY989_01710 [Candidatus Micrarchaeota archaeon]|nr:hypothetical protein [Candidatus Micrarchaeota archaeon]